MQTPREAARERQLFEAFVGGDDAAFATLFERYHDRLVRDARRYVSEDIAEDIVQDLFAWLWMHRARWVIRTTVRKYLHSAVRNRARDLLARAGTEHRAIDALRGLIGVPQVIGPEDLLLVEELEQVIADGLATCSARCRAVLMLRAESPRYADIARRLGIKPGTVQVLVKRGRRRLRHYLREQGWEDMISARPGGSSHETRLSHTARQAENRGSPSRTGHFANRCELDLAG